MPIYEYKCSNKKCSKITEKLFQSQHVTGIIECPDCKSNAFKIISQSNIIYKGSGFASKDLKSTTSSYPSSSSSSALSTSTQGGGGSGVGHYKETFKY